MTIQDADQLEHLGLAAQLAGLEVPDLVLPADHHVVLHGMRFHYLDWGTVDRRPILLLHGGGLTAHTWDLVCLALRPTYHCIALDQRGHGDSEWSPGMDYGLDAHRSDIEAFVEHLRLDGLILVGMSMGGANAIAYAGRHAARLAALVLVDVGPTVRAAGAKEVRDFMMQSEELDSVEEFVERAMTFNPLRDPRLLRRSLLHNLRRLPSGKWTWKYDRRHISRADVAGLTRRNEAQWSVIPHITCPTLVVRGAESRVLLDEDAEKLAQTLPRGRWVRIEGAGHTVQGDNPRGLVEAMAGFLGELGL